MRIKEDKERKKKRVVGLTKQKKKLWGLKSNSFFAMLGDSKSKSKPKILRV